MARLLYKILNPVADITGFGGGVGWTLSTGSDIYAILNYSDNLICSISSIISSSSFIFQLLILY